MVAVVAAQTARKNGVDSVAVAAAVAVAASWRDATQALLPHRCRPPSRQRSWSTQVKLPVTVERDAETLFAVPPMRILMTSLLLVAPLWVLAAEASRFLACLYVLPCLPSLHPSFLYSLWLFWQSTVQQILTRRMMVMVVVVVVVVIKSCLGVCVLWRVCWLTPVAVCWLFPHFD